MTAADKDRRALFRSLAFLAATFAVMFGALLPSAVIASASSDRPIVLCSNGELRTVPTEHGKQDNALQALRCADGMLAALAVVPPPPPPAPAPVVQAQAAPVLVRGSAAPPPARAPPRPWSTAPPQA